MIKSAIIGLGKMGVSHAAILGGLPDVELAAVCDTDSLVQSAFKKLTKVQVYSDYKKMIDEVKPDCVYVVTPTKFHYDMVMFALEKGCHVFCEKPFALTTEQGEKMLELAKSKGLVNQVGYHNRYIGTFNEMKRALGLCSNTDLVMGAACFLSMHDSKEVITSQDIKGLLQKTKNKTKINISQFIAQNISKGLLEEVGLSDKKQKEYQVLDSAHEWLQGLESGRKQATPNFAS